MSQYPRSEQIWEGLLTVDTPVRGIVSENDHCSPDLGNQSNSDSKAAWEGELGLQLDLYRQEEVVATLHTVLHVQYHHTKGL